MNPQEFATHYIPRALPWATIDFDGDSVQDIPAPFKKLVLERDFLDNDELGLRNEIHGKPSTQKRIAISADSKNLKGLHGKALVWCETNQKLLHLQKDPQTSTNPVVLTVKFSELHQDAVQDAKRSADEHKSTEQEAENGQMAQVSSDSEFTRKLHEIFGDIQPLKPQKVATPEAEKSQYELITTDQQVIDAKCKQRPPKPFWKKNVYPVQTNRQITAERRKLARPLTSEELELDYLPGIWEPQLMVNEFTLTGIDHDARIMLEADKDEAYEPVNWYDKQVCNEKCGEWLNSIRD